MTFVSRHSRTWSAVVAIAITCAVLPAVDRAVADDDAMTAQPTRLAPAADVELFPTGGAYIGEDSVFLGSDQHRLVSCVECGHFGAGCSCGPGTGETYGNGPFRNLFWCNPVGEEILDPCDLNGCRNCAMASAPLFYAAAELMVLARDQNDDVLFQTLGPGGPAALESGEFNTEFDAGMRLTLGTTLTDLYRLEGTYSGSYEWQTLQAVRDQSPNSQGGFGNLFSPFSNFGNPVAFIGTDFNEFAAIEFEGKFSSAELNVRRRVIVPTECWPQTRYHCTATSFLLGVRYLKLEERLRYSTSSSIPAGGSVNDVNVATDNDMIGLQIGMLSQFMSRRGRGWLDFEVKGGVYQNEANLVSGYRNADRLGGVIVDFADADSRDRTTFMGELSLNYNYPVTQRGTFRIGYNAMWLTGVALAPQNLSSNLNILAQGPAQVDHGGEVVFHGPSAGMVWAY